MSDYTTVTLSKDLKEELSSDMREDETWGDYLERLHTENTVSEPSETLDGLSEDDLDQIRSMFKEVAQDLDSNSSDQDRGEGAEVDYDHLREIVRDEVRQALEELIR